MGNTIRSDGMINDTKVTKVCELCFVDFEGWSDEAKCIKGRMPKQPYCPTCQAEKNKAFVPDFQALFDNMTKKN